MIGHQDSSYSELTQNMATKLAWHKIEVGLDFFAV